MKTIFVNETDPLQNALDEAAKCTDADGVLIELSDGVHAGNEKARLFYDSPEPLEIRGKGAEKCVLRGENCESYHKDTENRAILTFGEKCTRVSLFDFTIENAHIKTADDCSLGNQAEAICWHNKTGKLFCSKMTFKSRQDTIHVKGFSHFVECEIFGDVDFIWGYCDTSLFEKCKITTIRDNRGENRPAYVLQSRALNSKVGFVFDSCEFFAEDRGENAKIYIGRTEGTGRADSLDRWDSIALLDCVISEQYDSALWTNEEKRVVFPQKGSALCGWREFETKIRQKDGAILPYNKNAQNKHGFSMTKSDAEILRAAVKSNLKL